MKNAKFLQRAGAFALALTMALSLAGCGQAASGSSQAASSAPVSSAASSEAASSQAQGPIQLSLSRTPDFTKVVPGTILSMFPTM